MGQRSTCDNTAATAVADECINDDWNPDNKRFLRPFEANDDILLIKELGISGKFAVQLADDIRTNAAKGTAYTIFVDNKVISIAGVVEIRKGIGESWSAPTPAIRSSPKFYFKTIKWGVHDGINQFNLRRIQTVCRTDDPVAYEWQKRLGFEFEGVMRKYNDDGTDAIRMALICKT